MAPGSPLPLSEFQLPIAWPGVADEDSEHEQNDDDGDDDDDDYDGDGGVQSGNSKVTRALGPLLRASHATSGARERLAPTQADHSLLFGIQEKSN